MWMPPWTGKSITSSPAFQRWFGNSVVRNPDGSPKVVYHGTSPPVPFTVFRQSSDPDRLNIGFHFGTYEQASERVGPPDEIIYPRIYPVYLSIQRPLVTPDLNTWSSVEVGAELMRQGLIGPKDFAAIQQVGDRSEHAALAKVHQLLRTLKIDGFLYENAIEGAGTSYVVLDPSQIKSATGNRGTFDPNDPDILHGWR
jgi:hypothetical protein